MAAHVHSQRTILSSRTFCRPFIIYINLDIHRTVFDKVLSFTGCHSQSSSSSSSELESDFEDHTNEELEHKKNHPLRLHPELWFNDRGEVSNEESVKPPSK